MSFSIGLDIGGSKIAGAVFDKSGKEIAQVIQSTPESYDTLVDTCTHIVHQLDDECGVKATVGVGVPGSVEYRTGIVTIAANTSCLTGKSLQSDLSHVLLRHVKLANDADCAALSEAVDGAGAGFPTVFGLIMGTGVGGGYVMENKLAHGANGLIGEFGQLPLPFREDSDGPLVDCVCGQRGCIDKSISGPALARLYKRTTGQDRDATQIGALARSGDVNARRVLDQFFITVAKAMITIIHAFDPYIIVVSGGLNQLPGLYEEVPKHWERYAMAKNLKTQFVPAKHGAMSGLRGAAWVGRGN